MTKVAVGCAEPDILRDRLMARAANGEVTITTRYKPTRSAEMIGGSLYWIIRHTLVARQRILGFTEAEDGRWLIRLEASLVPVAARRKRAHQGWRYLKAADAPADLAAGGGDTGALPDAMLRELVAIGLL
ncbi:DUF1489 family protein [Sphingomonas sp. 1P06PA]|uniref:DUF1489 family protein n=1 Tax=Sphingomonas sp. 1P06PA TaxID=554121 RepID=UPI0039A4A71B